VLSTLATRRFGTLVDGDQSKKRGVNMSYLVSCKTTYQLAVERDHGRLRTHRK